jgi:hypothetical protein
MEALRRGEGKAISSDIQMVPDGAELRAYHRTERIAARLLGDSADIPPP